MIRLPIKITKKGFIIGFFLWTLWAMFYAVILSIGAHLLYVFALASSLISYYPLALLSIPVIEFCRRYKFEHQKIVSFVIVHFIVALLFAATWQTIDSLAHLLLFGPLIFDYRPIDGVGVFHFYNGVLLYALIAGICYTSETYKKYREKELKAAQLQTLNREAELKALKSQINPHFLFNTLNTIFALIDSHKEKAKNTITKLSELLRYSLSGYHRDFVPLETEIESIKTYLAIEKARFDDRLIVDISINPEISQTNVPPMILQPLVENAVKHGISPYKEGGIISISVKKIEDELEFEIKDSGKGHASIDKDQNDANGIGLLNLQERLKRIYGNNFYFKAGPIDPRGFLVTMRFNIDDASE